MVDINDILDRYEEDISSVGLYDIFDLVKYIASKHVTLSPDEVSDLKREDEASPPSTIQGIYALRSNTGSAVNNQCIITVGVHGNEIYTGGICALEALSQHRQGNLKGHIIIQLGNIEAIQGYIKHYNSGEYFLDRNGWRETNGMASEVQTISHDNQDYEIYSDFNRVHKDIMHLPRGQHYNIDRGQELTWLHRAFSVGYTINESAQLEKTPHTISTKFVLHPHTSRMVGGIRNIALTKQGSEVFASGGYDFLLHSLPVELRTFLKWLGDGLGGSNHKTFDQHLEDDLEGCAHSKCIITIEFGNHEDIRPEEIMGLQPLSKAATHNFLLYADIIDLPKEPLNTNPIEVVYAEPLPSNISYFDGVKQLEENDTLYMVCESKYVPYSKDYIKTHFTKSILVDSDNICEVIDTKNMSDDEKRKIFYAMPPFELSFIKKGQSLLLGFGADKKAKFLTSPHDAYAIFTGDARNNFPINNWKPEKANERVFNVGKVSFP